MGQNNGFDETVTRPLIENLTERIRNRLSKCQTSFQYRCVEQNSKPLRGRQVKRLAPTDYQQSNQLTYQTPRMSSLHHRPRTLPPTDSASETHYDQWPLPPSSPPIRAYQVDTPFSSNHPLLSPELCQDT